MHCVTNDQLQKEEGSIDSQQDHNARGLGGCHVGVIGARERRTEFVGGAKGFWRAFEPVVLCSDAVLGSAAGCYGVGI